jgi:hypothetical protein
MVPKVFYVTEKSWNFYPYTRTEYQCSFIPRFNIRVETVYRDDNGREPNVCTPTRDDQPSCSSGHHTGPSVRSAGAEAGARCVGSARGGCD